VNLTPPEADDGCEAITHVEYHPKRSDVFLFSSSKGYISLCDLRISSQFNSFAVKLERRGDSSKRHAFTELINSVGMARFAPTSEHHLYSRDYLSVHVWDVRSNSAPVQTLNVTEYLDGQLGEAYADARIFDKFDL